MFVSFVVKSHTPTCNHGTGPFQLDIFEIGAARMGELDLANAEPVQGAVPEDGRAPGSHGPRGGQSWWH